MFIPTKDGSYTILSAAYNTNYHSMHGAYQESMHVFIQAALAFYVQKNSNNTINIFEMGYGTGFNTILTYQYALENNLKINYTSIDNHPILNFDAVSFLQPVKELNHLTQIFETMNLASWNLETNIDEHFTLNKLNLSILEYNCKDKYDIIYYDAFAPNTQPELWTVEIMSKMYDMLKTGGVLTTYCAQGQLKRNLKEVGFKLEAIPGPLYKREMTRAIK